MESINSPLIKLKDESFIETKSTAQKSFKKANGKFDRKAYMRDYMREYARKKTAEKKQKTQQLEINLKETLDLLINLINLNINSFSNETIDEIEELVNNDNINVNEKIVSLTHFIRDFMKI